MPDITEVQINIVNAVELKPDKKYLLAFDHTQFSTFEAHNVLDALKDMGINNAIALMTNGNPNDVVKIIEQ